MTLTTPVRFSFSSFLFTDMRRAGAIVAALSFIAAFFCSFVWDQRFNLTAGLFCLAFLTLSIVLTLNGAYARLVVYARQSAARPVLIMMAALFVWIWGRSFTSDVPATSLLSAGYYVVPFLVAAFVMARETALPRFVFFSGAAIMTFIVAAGFKLAFIDGFAGRIDWPMQDANHFAMIMNATFIAGLGLFLVPRTRVFGAVICVIALMGIMLAASRAGMIALVIALAIFAILVLPRLVVSRRLILIGVGILGALVVLMTILRPDQVSAFYNLIRGFSDFRSLHGTRPEIWLATLQLIAARPLFGYGTGTFLFIYPQALTPTQINSGYAAHNDLLQMTLETGVIGGLLYAGFGLSIVYAAWRTRQVSQAPTLTLVRATSLAVMVVLALHAQIEFMMMVAPVLILFGVALGVFMRVSFGPGAETSPQPSNQLRARGEMGAAVVLVALLVLSITQTYGQICAQRANLAFAQKDKAAFVANIEKSMFYTMDQHYMPYLLQASYLLNLRLSGVRDDLVDLGQIRALLQAAQARNPYVSSVQDGMGRVDELSGQSPEGAWRAGLCLDPRNADLRLSLLRYYERTGRRSDAQALAEETQKWWNLRGGVDALRAAMSPYIVPSSKD